MSNPSSPSKLELLVVWRSFIGDSDGLYADNELVGPWAIKEEWLCQCVVRVAVIVEVEGNQ